MSGGSMNYLSSKIEMDATFHTDTPERKAFRKHLFKVIKALHEIEWEDSCDTSPGTSVPAIMQCITPADCLKQAIEDAKSAQKALEEAIKRAEP